eukprot:CAMPEP_0194315596 /NCGR_PEP_ID=MMETSP0171-20130528/12403_1 /TAXON_ID=218684 /ORGANISM="Corethron pennatum, Strain L29A3" /LENGTH=131 /DNA_ID=CAMNT_0039071473 /DNA_START=40 /DNA_END=434 /DNA_ORIENTATION=-
MTDERRRPWQTLFPSSGIGWGLSSWRGHLAGSVRWQESVRKQCDITFSADTCCRAQKGMGGVDKFNEAALAAALANVREEVNRGSDAVDKCGAYEVLRAATSENSLGAEAVAASCIRRDELTNWPKVRWSL